MSVAVTVTVIVPETVDPFVGAVIATTGGVKSPGVGVGVGEGAATPAVKLCTLFELIVE